MKSPNGNITIIKQNNQRESLLCEDASHLQNSIFPTIEDGDNLELSLNDSKNTRVKYK